MKKVLFLDIDGVLNSDQWYDRAIEMGGYDVLGESFNFDPICVNMICKILEDTGADLVMTSSWRHDKKLKSIFMKVGLPAIFDTTNFIIRGDRMVERGEEIDEYIKRNKVDRYVIIDDDCDMLEYQKEWLINTDALYGLTAEEMYKAIELLNK